MQVYFSHSYRDVEINTYFFNILVKQDLELFADQKSPTWCVAKLERYLHELPGFLSVVPRRTVEDGSIAYSPYIGYELSLARRSRVPRLLFVDDEVLNRYRHHFPRDAVPFVRASPASDQFRHIDAIEKFGALLKSRGKIPGREYRDRSVLVVAAGDGPILSQGAEALMDVLRSKSYDVRQIKPTELSGALNDVGILEAILESEMCVFLLEQEVTNADVVLAMAYANTVPSILLQYDPNVAKVEAVAESGRIRWSATNDLLFAFESQVDSYRMGAVQAVSTQDVRNIAITQRTPRPEQLWDPNNGAALIDHIYPGDSHVSDIVNATRKLIGGSFVGAEPLEICTLLYRFIRTQHFAYEHEPPSLVPNRQAIRTANDIWNDNAGTCLDLACLFASLLKSSGLNPVIVILTRPNFSHALVGYKVPPVSWETSPDLGDLRGALVMRNVTLFEPTGAVEHETAVAGESDKERRDGNRTLEFDIAKNAAERLINSEIELKFLLEIP